MESVLQSMSGSSKSNSHHDHHESDSDLQDQRNNSRDSKFSKTEMISDMKSIGGIFHSVPRGALLFGSAGLVPYLATSITTIYLARQVYKSEHGTMGKFDSETALTLLYHNENLQVAYGAVILSFLGAIHWGIEFAAEGTKSTPQLEPKGVPRYLLGTLPVLLAWPTLLLPGQLALASQWAAFTIVWYTDMIATGKGWTPKWYSTYRFGLTAIVGGSLIITLAATNYWAIDDTGYSSTSRKLQVIRERENIQNAKDRQDGGTGGIKIEGNLNDQSLVGSVSGEDSFVLLKDLKKSNESKSKDD
ncbi:uncharacterized protein MELLADRAFT_66561 [Melampsora larici-populina 98AG31]|uniref:Uncharacterized protein n=1 Tax=Melampsora larici-populina (strain 98AG31 / pathotype 3-4-7) TaxID=747676 RepID=F4RZQ8_MELLP|nr:uncharacterized protein MELLADRAFT_66561 [Melampsora larici-populina 98AG31]EGG02044.1 hypothetical protein MELLADRAFT_66561 [Melampsora larici-populina 98AG31]